MVTNLFHASLAIFGPLGEKMNMCIKINLKSKSWSKFFLLLLASYTAA